MQRDIELKGEKTKLGGGAGMKEWVTDGRLETESFGSYKV